MIVPNEMGFFGRPKHELAGLASMPAFNVFFAFGHGKGSCLKDFCFGFLIFT